MVGDKNRKTIRTWRWQKCAKHFAFNSTENLKFSLRSVSRSLIRKKFHSINQARPAASGLLNVATHFLRRKFLAAGEIEKHFYDQRVSAKPLIIPATLPVAVLIFVYVLKIHRCNNVNALADA